MDTDVIIVGCRVGVVPSHISKHEDELDQAHDHRVIESWVDNLIPENLAEVIENSSGCETIGLHDESLTVSMLGVRNKFR